MNIIMNTTMLLRFESSLSFLLLVFVLLLQYDGTFAYDDLRGKGCRASRIRLENIPGDEVEWTGNISLRLHCDPGYDYPLNFNEETSTDVISCESDNRWKPDFIPDCNKETSPVLIASFTGKVQIDACERKAKRDLSDICNDKKDENESEKSKKVRCAVVNSHLSCNSKTSGELDLTVEIPRRPKETDKDHQILKEKVGDRISDYLGLGEGSSSGFSSDRLLTAVKCPDGTARVELDGGRIVRCRGCPIGFFLQKKTQTCEPCGKSFYQDTQMQSSCKTCPSLRAVKVDSHTWSLALKVAGTRVYHVLGCPVMYKNGTMAILSNSGRWEIQQAFEESLKGRRISWSKEYVARPAGTSSLHSLSLLLHSASFVVSTYHVLVAPVFLRFW